MTFLEFLASLVSSLAWPATIFLAIFFLRKPLVELIPLLKKLKYKEFEAEFRDALEATPVPPTIATDDTLSADSPGDLLKSRNYYLQLAEVSPRSAIMEAWLELESASSDAYTRIVKPGMKVFMNPRDTAQYLYGQSLITEDEYKSFQSLARLRNKAAHETDLSDMNQKVVGEYVDFCLTLASKIRALQI
ncbi:hypothetical protein ACFSSA_08860 [Luteolibacter algae]|uniref:DUF4145 domain-containing protein n=1 Tax=Luteolibacter algae TaxID=454151 RepID=A0ABW5D6P5_9BACT